MVDSSARVMTWNIWWRIRPRWPDRQPGILATLERVRPDVVALQEVWGSSQTTQAHELADALGMHAVFAAPSYPVAPSDPNRQDWAGIELGVAVLSQWPVLEHSAHVLPARHRTWDPVALASGSTIPPDRCQSWPRVSRTASGRRAEGQPGGGLYPSDHRAVVADIRWRGRLRKAAARPPSRCTG